MHCHAVDCNFVPAFHHRLHAQLDAVCREHELAATLLSSLYHEIIQAAQMQKGFRNLLHSVDDLKLDVPSAEDDIALFLARAVVDDVLPPSFLQKVPCGELVQLVTAVKTVCVQSTLHCALPELWLIRLVMPCLL